MYDQQAVIGNIVRAFGGKGNKCRCPCHADTNASLSLKVDPVAGKPLVTCYAGCDRHRIQDTLRDQGFWPYDLPHPGYHGVRAKATPIKSRGKQPRQDAPQHAQKSEKVESLPPATENAPTVTPRTLVEDYEYKDMSAALACRKRRYSDKSFLWQLWTPTGWVNGLGGIGCKWLYRHTEAREAIGAGRGVLFVEGEKDANTAWNNDLPAVSAPNSSGFIAEYLEQIPGAVLAVVPDNDPTGYKHGHSIAQGFQQAGHIVYWVPMPDGFKDLTEYIEAGHTKADVTKLIDAAKEYSPPVVDSEPPQTEVPALSPDGDPYRKYGAAIASDTCNARRLAHRYAGELRYVDGWDRWVHWDGKMWKPDDHAAVQLAKETARLIYDEELAAAGGDEHLQEHLSKWAAKSCQRSQIMNMIELGKSEEKLLTKHSDYDSDPDVLNCVNGVVDLKTGKLLDHDKTRLCTKITATEYDPDATCPEWDEFLRQITKGRKDLIDYLQLAMGYSITGRQDINAFFFCHGGGCNGKTTLLESMQRVMGTYATTMKAKTLMSSPNRQDADPGIEKLEGCRLVVVDEADKKDKFDEGLLKSLTGDSAVTARGILQRREKTFRPVHHLWGQGNHKPQIAGTDAGIWRRMHLIPFVMKFDDPDTAIKHKFYSDPVAQRAILAWAVRGAAYLYAHDMKLVQPECVKQSTEDYREEMDALGQWIDECCMTDLGNKYVRARAKDLHASYVEFMKTMGYNWTTSVIGLGKELQDRGFQRSKDVHKVTWYEGLAVKPE